MKTKLLFFANIVALCTLTVYAQQQEEPAKPPVEVKSGVMVGQLLKRVDPRYPAKAKVDHIQGDVILSAVIDKEGNIKTLKVVSGDPILADAATDAVKQWKYRPYLLEGQPVEAKTSITIKFHM